MEKIKCTFPNCSCYGSPLICEQDKRQIAETHFSEKILYFVYGAIAGAVGVTVMYFLITVR